MEYPSWGTSCLFERSSHHLTTLVTSFGCSKSSNAQWNSEEAHLLPRLTTLAWCCILFYRGFRNFSKASFPKRRSHHLLGPSHRFRSISWMFTLMRGAQGSPFGMRMCDLVVSQRRSPSHDHTLKTRGIGQVLVIKEDVSKAMAPRLGKTCVLTRQPRWTKMVPRWFLGQMPCDTCSVCIFLYVNMYECTFNIATHAVYP